MSLFKLLNLMRMQSEVVHGNFSFTRIGIISAYDPNNYCAKVIYQPDQIESGWLPIFSPWIGNGWGMICPPSLGDMVEVHFQEGDFEVGVISLRGFNDIDRPLPVPSGEFWLVHQTGSLLKFRNDGSIELHSHQNLNVTIGGTANLTAKGDITASAPNFDLIGNVNVTGNIKASGDVSDRANNNIQSMRNIYDNHTHIDSQGNKTSPPDSKM